MPEPTKHIYLLADESHRTENNKLFSETINLIERAAETDQNIIPIYLENYKNDYQLANAIKEKAGTDHYSLYVLEHGGYDGSFGKFQYKNVFSYLSDNIISINVLNCHSGSALKYGNALPAGTLLYPSVSEQSLDYMFSTNRVPTIGTGIGDTFLDELNDSFIIYSYFNEYEQKKAPPRPAGQPPYPSDPNKIIPRKFAISGYGTIDLEEQMSRLKGQALNSSTIEKVRHVFQDGEAPLLEEDQVEQVAKKINQGETLDYWQDKAIGYALTYVELENTGQIGRWQEEAHQQQQKIMEAFKEKKENLIEDYSIRRGVNLSEAQELIETSIYTDVTNCGKGSSYSPCTRAEGLLSQITELQEHLLPVSKGEHVDPGQAITPPAIPLPTHDVSSQIK